VASPRIRLLRLGNRTIEALMTSLDPENSHVPICDSGERELGPHGERFRFVRSAFRNVRNFKNNNHERHTTRQ
jgi:hypothetical protein